MQYSTLATDYDGTLATDGYVDEATLQALHRWRNSGRQLILITGRRLDDLMKYLTAIDLFDQVVVENGGVLYTPATQVIKPLATPPNEGFKQLLRDRVQQAQTAVSDLQSEEFKTLVRDGGYAAVEFGQVIIATWEPYLTTVEAAIREANLPLRVILNKGAVMVLPEGVDKASGLRSALAERSLSPEATVGVGDAENDLDFLKLCGFSVAVANALPLVQQAVDWVTAGERGAGVVELIDRVLAEESAALK